MSKINKINVDGISYDIEDTSKESLENKVTSLSSESTDEQYPSAKVVWDLLQDTVPSINSLPIIGGLKDSIDLFTAAPGIYIPNKDKQQYLSIGNTFITCKVILVAVVNKYKENPSESRDIAYLFYIDTDAGSKTRYDFIIRKWYIPANTTTFTNEIILNTYGFLTKYNQNIDGVKTFTDLPVSTPIPTTDNQLTNKKYVDDSISNAMTNINTPIVMKLPSPFDYSGDDEYYAACATFGDELISNIDNNKEVILVQSGIRYINPIIERDGFGYILYVYASGEAGEEVYSSYNDDASLSINKSNHTLTLTYESINDSMGTYHGDYSEDTNNNGLGQFLYCNNNDDTNYFIPTAKSQPVSKGYVDSQIGNVNAILATLTTPSNNGGGE